MVEIKIENISKFESKIFVDNLSCSLANALRRIMISEVPTLSIDLVSIEINTSLITDEFLSHRLGLIPLRSTCAKKMKFSRECECDNYCSRCSSIFKLDLKSTNPESLVYSTHLENLKPLLNNINNIKGLEVRLCSKTLGLAGTADCIAEYNGVPSIIDFKTAGKKKKESWIKKYFMQTTAYSLMWEELTGEKIDQIVILMTVEEGGRVEFIKQREDYVTDLNEIIELFKVGGSLISY